MKIAALIPFRNEARLLPCCLSSLQGVADEIIGMDDQSTDGSGDIVRSFGGHVLVTDSDMSGFSQGKEKVIRQRLLDEARRMDCSHFICLDADEALTAPFRNSGRTMMEQLSPGHKIALPWLTLWGSPKLYRDGDYSKFHRVFRAVIVRDSPNLPQYSGFLHMPRTPGSDASSNVTRCPPASGAILHFTAEDIASYRMKIAWYHCVELVRTPNEAERINRFYFRDWDETHLQLRRIPDSWSEGLPLDAIAPAPPSWQEKEILRLFDENGAEYFEPLEIWGVESLREEFIRRVGREPRSAPWSTKLFRRIRLERKRLERWQVDMTRRLRGERF